MAKKTKVAKKTAKRGASYRHKQKAVLRPEGGAQDVFPQEKRKPPKHYRYDSSLAPELAWDESGVRDEAEQLIAEILNAENLDEVRDAGEQLKSLSSAFLNWSGKAEHTRFDVPTLPLFTHERLSTEAVLANLKSHFRPRGETLDLFGETHHNAGEKVRGAYEHTNGWQNRLILGDSLQVMNSLLEYEGLGRQVQMVYMDPPYGIKFGSNFQPYVRKREVKDGDDDYIAREPEMVQAYRDTWVLGVHSWLAYMRDRLLLARELLTDSGSCFVQISDENVHFVRCVMDEVFGVENFVSLIAFSRAAARGTGAKGIDSVSDYLVWYARNKESMRYCRLYKKVGNNDPAMSPFSYVEEKDGSRRSMTSEEKKNPQLLPKKSRRYRLVALSSQTKSDGTNFAYAWEGTDYSPHSNRGWKVSKSGLDVLAGKKRLQAQGNYLCYIRYADERPGLPYTNQWVDTASVAGERTYVVQTANKIVQRCMLMTTHPGDLVLDPTCGSGTTAVTAEQWGRRWITTDVSRVPLSLARQRLLTATYDYYELQDQQLGPAGGFVYERKQNKKGEETGGIVPHITLKSIANNQPPAEEVLWDKPKKDTGVVRITGPFCVEAVLPTPLSPGMQEEDCPPLDKYEDANDHIARMVGALRSSPTLHLPDKEKLVLENVRMPARAMAIHAEATRTNNTYAEEGEQVAIVFGPANCAISERNVSDAAREARKKNYALLLVIAFAIEPAARKDITNSQDTFGMQVMYLQASTDLVMKELLRHTRASQLFAAVGDPDIKLAKTGKKSADGDPLWQVTLRGLDTFDPVKMEAKSISGDEVPCWMLDTNYDDNCFRACQVFFPLTSAWDKIQKAVRVDFDDSVWEHLASKTSAPFVAGEKIAVKVIDARGNELMAVERVSGGKK